MLKVLVWHSLETFVCQILHGRSEDTADRYVSKIENYTHNVHSTTWHNHYIDKWHEQLECMHAEGWQFEHILEISQFSSQTYAHRM